MIRAHCHHSPLYRGQRTLTAAYPVFVLHLVEGHDLEEECFGVSRVLHEIVAVGHGGRILRPRNACAAGSQRAQSFLNMNTSLDCSHKIGDMIGFMSESLN
jgi:hypothetical protein